MTKDQIMGLVDAYAWAQAQANKYPSDSVKRDEARAAVVAALEQGVSSVHTQEPVAWMQYVDKYGDYEFNKRREDCRQGRTAVPLYTTPQPAEPLEFPEPMKVSTAPSYDFANGWNACLATINAKRGVK